MLGEILINQTLTPIGPTNFLKVAISFLLSTGVSKETVVLLLLFPLVASLVATARYLIGIRGFGLFTPAMLGVAFLEIGLLPGLILFLIVLGIATLSRLLMRRLKVHYLSRMALVVWFITITVLASLFWIKASIFPILFLILLSENFIEVQVGKSLREATRLTVETIILSLGILGILQLQFLRRFVLNQPEIVVLGTPLLNILVGRFTGMRLFEYVRFRALLGKK